MPPSFASVRRSPPSRRRFQTQIFEDVVARCLRVGQNAIGSVLGAVLHCRKASHALLGRNIFGLHSYNLCLPLHFLACTFPRRFILGACWTSFHEKQHKNRTRPERSPRFLHLASRWRSPEDIGMERSHLYHLLENDNHRRVCSSPSSIWWKSCSAAAVHAVCRCDYIHSCILQDICSSRSRNTGQIRCHVSHLAGH